MTEIMADEDVERGLIDVASAGEIVETIQILMTAQGCRKLTNLG